MRHIHALLDGGSPMRRSWAPYALTAAAVTACAVAGAKAVDADSAWYRGLDKPPWQPPPWTFGAVWTPLYASIAWSGGRALGRARAGERRVLAGSLGVNLALNAAWNWAFFARRSPWGGVLGTLVLDMSNAELIRRTRRIDTTAAKGLLPYAGWCLFATALNVSIARRNR
ncbi:TspO/MBR family protein [Streptomyces drozdowiczii]|uniref:Tryptophan-rich sensory protein n=1 Tax=Streptomyces drozdowiczii TaxID=202862 RepID=A0ABY6Q025_9ACTN|nr:TspO/MBR family protein [Streptomyces drozdowiczii]MCX0241928.1 tryptophan-rich sensory protein [Streptomyces drozdowiczii]UZK57960.1 tryptophan-rich sensory protein [Streptomyces drozdowiczii]